MKDRLFFVVSMLALLIWVCRNYDKPWVQTWVSNVVHQAF